MKPPMCVRQVRYQAVRSKLNDLHYFQPLSVESALLAERVVADRGRARTWLWGPNGGHPSRETG